MGKLNVQFYEKVSEEKVRFVVIATEYQHQWIWAKHRERNTFEMPGGHRELGEDALQAAERELKEETGALKFTIEPICGYSVTGKTRVNESGQTSYGMLYFAHVEELGEIHSEIESIALFEDIPKQLTYPDIQPKLLFRVMEKRAGTEKEKKP